MVEQQFINLDFFFEKNVVGIFEELDCSTKDGEYRYQPYRGFGHYEMWQTIREKGFAVCYYIKEKEKISFKVEDAGEYGKLLLSEFRREII